MSRKSVKNRTGGWKKQAEPMEIAEKFLITAYFTGNAIIERKNPTGSSRIIPFKVPLSGLSSLSVLRLIGFWTKKVPVDRQG